MNYFMSAVEKPRREKDLAVLMHRWFLKPQEWMNQPMNAHTFWKDIPGLTQVTLPQQCQQCGPISREPTWNWQRGESRAEWAWGGQLYHSHA